MASQPRVIIACAVTGAMNACSLSSLFPIALKGNDGAAFGAGESGAAIIRSQVRVIRNCKPDL
jgi:uncharacterized protein (DUF849 family)